jgi:formimidoylglutamate deiminase
MPNLHSHAFQRVFAGLTEFRGSPDDSFWSWRTLMYRFASRVTPDQLDAIATWVFVEMLEAGYTSVCEFHYLHHDRDGAPYADDATLSRCILHAAERAGLGLTLLPVLYQTGGFDGRPAAGAQRRFARSTDSMLALLDRMAPVCRTQGARLGLALHSLRAVPPDNLRAVLDGLDGIDPTAPVHIHVAEQTREVDDCLAATGQRPVAWLLDHAPVDARWCLVHATHMTDEERRGAARQGAVAGLCPTTEANLGDGLFDLPAWLEVDGRWGVGSDSHVCVNAAEELLLLEYGQRLRRARRNVAAREDAAWTATAMTLDAVAGGAQAGGRAGLAGLAEGARADLVVLDAADPLLAGLTPAGMLAAHVFASHRRSAIADVLAGGVRRVAGGRHPLRDEAAAAFVAARAGLIEGESGGPAALAGQGPTG